jgi:hypothetical protein
MGLNVFMRDAVVEGLKRGKRESQHICGLLMRVVPCENAGDSTKSCSVESNHGGGSLLRSGPDTNIDYARSRGCHRRSRAFHLHNQFSISLDNRLNSFLI